MKTIGQRIAQAREAKGWTGADLAKKVGYKHQSAIGNIENRLGGHGGHKIAKIAEALEVPIEWILRGPDSDEVPFTTQASHYTNTSAAPPVAKEESRPYITDASIDEAMTLFRQLNTSQRLKAISFMRRLLEEKNDNEPPQDSLAIPNIAA